MESMKRTVLITANATVGVITISLSIFGLFHSTSVSDRQSALLLLGFGALFCVVAYGLWTRSRLLVTLSSVPIILIAAVASFILVFAPLAWGDSNIGTVYTLQFLSLSFAVLQIASLLHVFAAKHTNNGDKEA
jgi:NADH:ubiquinone oxidoreductase subunit K